jgi:phosphoribosylaminoimidazolecarboxamide formyltransferase / IMP cyclohydrolase
MREGLWGDTMAERRREKEKYFTIMDDHFPANIEVVYRRSGHSPDRQVFSKVSWLLPDEEGRNVRKGLRYGENPGQEAALYQLKRGNLKLGKTEYIGPGKGLVSAIKAKHMLQVGKHPGKINLTDIDNALNILRYLSAKPACAIMKHNNPCGVAWDSSAERAYSRAFGTDIVAAFGGAAVMNRSIDWTVAEMMNKQYLEVVCAPGYEEGVVEILKQRKNLRIIEMPGIADLAQYRDARYVDIKSLMDGGLVMQQSLVNMVRGVEDLTRATHSRQGTNYSVNRWPPTKQELDDMVFGWAVECGVSSNSVLFVKDGRTVAIGTGQQDRVDVTIMARDKAYRKLSDTACRITYRLPYNDLSLLIDHKVRKITTTYDDPRVQELSRDSIDELREFKLNIDRQVARVHGGLEGAVAVSDAFFPERDGVDIALREGVRAFVQPGGSDKDYKAIQACNEYNATMAFTGQRVFKH